MRLTADHTMLQRLEVLPKSGVEPFIHHGEATGVSLLEFWQWSSSDLVSNTLRGRLAEFIVARALGVADGVRAEWDAYDLTLRNGVTVEVKSSAYHQTWAQQVESTPTFDIRATRAWSADTNAYAPASDLRRQATVYVFALLAHRDRATLNPLDLAQWEFHVVPTSTLNAAMGARRRISLVRLRAISPSSVTFDELRECLSNFEAGTV